MHKLALSFLLGATTPAVSIYLTGGSNRSLFTFGFLLALALIIIPSLIWADRVSNMLAGMDKAKQAFKVHMRGDKVEDGIVETIPAPVLHPWRDDIVSALVNLKMSKKRAEELFREMVGEREYQSMEEMLHAAFIKARKDFSVHTMFVPKGGIKEMAKA